MVYCLYPKYHTFQLIVKFIVSLSSDYDTSIIVLKAIYTKLLLLFYDILWYNIDYILETTILRLYVEGDKRTGGFITSMGVYLCWFIHHSHYWGSPYHKVKRTTNHQTVS